MSHTSATETAFVLVIGAAVLVPLPARGAEVPFNKSVISTSADEALSVFAADLDGDGDTDVLSASRADDKIAWYENDGLPDPTFTEVVITNTGDGATSVFAADLDLDGDIDVLAALRFENMIAWYENDGAANPNFPERVISVTAVDASSVFAADVDGDGDIDVLAALEEGADKIVWYENDGLPDPTFTEQPPIVTGADGAISVFAADLDGDGDIDVLSASKNDDTIAWHENDGEVDPSFTEHVISNTADAAWSVFAADLDGDGDIDVLAASTNDDTIAWYENDGAADPTFTERVISDTANSASSVFAADVDGDGDTDVLSASLLDDTIAWYENDGLPDPTFTPWVISITADGAHSVFATDLDRDGDTDVLSASVLDDTIAWHENTTPIPPIPTVSEWGLIVMTLMVMTLATIMLARRRSAHA